MVLVALVSFILGSVLGSVLGFILAALMKVSGDNND